MKQKTQTKYGQYCLNIGQVQKIISIPYTLRNKIIIEILAYCGLRRGEIIKLCLSDIDLDEQLIRVKGKYGKKRDVPIPDILLSDLRIYLKNIRGGYIFPSKNKNGSHIAGTHINRIVKNTAMEAGVKNPNPNLKHINPHIFRHSYARRLKDRGVSMEAIQNVLGHENFRTTMDTYGLMSAKEIKDNVKKAFESEEA